MNRIKVELEFISIKEQKPPIFENVLVLVDHRPTGGAIHIGTDRTNKRGVWNNYINVTHWCMCTNPVIKE